MICREAPSGLPDAETQASLGSSRLHMLLTNPRIPSYSGLVDMA